MCQKTQYHCRVLEEHYGEERWENKFIAKQFKYIFKLPNDSLVTVQWNVLNFNQTVYFKTFLN